MHSLFFFFYLCDENSLLCGFWFLGYFEFLLKSSRILWMSICHFIPFLSLMHRFMHLLTSFSLCFSSLGVFSSLLDESQDFSIFDRQVFDYFCCCGCRHAALHYWLFLISLVLLLEWNTIEPASSAWCGNRAPKCSSVLRSGCSSSFTAFVGHVSSSFFFSFDQVGGRCFGSRFPCLFAVSAAVAAAAASVGCRRPTVLTSMLTQSWITPSVCICATALHASSFNLLCFCFLKCAICFCCCTIFSFSLCFCVLPFFLCFSFFCGGGIFYYFDDFLIFFELGHFDTDSFFSLCTSFTFFRVVFSFQIFMIRVLSRHWDCEGCHDTSVVASHVDHVVGCSVFDVFQVSSFCKNVVDFVSHCLLEIWRSSVSEVSFWTSCWGRCNLETSASFSTSHLFCFPRWECICQHFYVPFHYQVPAQHWSHLQWWVSNYYNAPCVSRLFLCIFSMWWSAYFEWVKTTLINLMCRRMTKIVVVMARSLMYSVSMILCFHLLFNIIPTPCLLSNFPDPMKMCLWCVSHISACSCLHVSLNRNCVPSVAFELAYHFFDFFTCVHWPHTFCSMMNVTSLFSYRHLFFQ